MGYVRQMNATSKVQIPDTVQKEAELIVHHKIARIVKGNNISSYTLLNVDQIASKFVPIASIAPALRSEISITITGKRIITATFSISHDGNVLPM